MERASALRAGQDKIAIIVSEESGTLAYTLFAISKIARLTPNTLQTNITDGPLHYNSQSRCSWLIDGADNQVYCFSVPLK